MSIKLKANTDGTSELLNNSDIVLRLGVDNYPYDKDGNRLIGSGSNGSGTPSSDASYLGEIYIDSSVNPRQAYVAVNIGTGVSDWRQITV